MKKILQTICIASAAALSACVNLDLAPLSEGSSETWYSSQSEIEMSLNDFYRTDFFPVLDKSWGDDVTWRNSTQSVQNGTMTAEDGTVATRWQNYYKGIARALRLLGRMDDARTMGISEADILQYEGEAYFYLGYAYGMLAFFWGDAILDKTGMTLDEAYRATRSPKADVLAYAYRCFDEAARRLPETYPASNAPHAAPPTPSRPARRFGTAITTWRRRLPRTAWT